VAGTLGTYAAENVVMVSEMSLATGTSINFGAVEVDIVGETHSGGFSIFSFFQNQNVFCDY
jgi:hypothetical protein